VNPDDPIREVAAIVLAADGAHGAALPACLRADEGEPWVRRATRAALDARLWPVVAVVGDHADEVRAALAGLPVATVADAGFDRGPGGSVRLGLRRVTECAPRARGVVLVACGSAALDPWQLQALVAAAGERAGALAAYRREGRLTLPAFFPATAFHLLRALGVEEGCGELLARHAAEVVAVEEG
jgi:molybdenum cofactor cytidylyltransferase